MGSDGSNRDPELVTRYEELRGQVMDASGHNGNGQGWALFVRKGMAVWMEAWQETARRQELPPIPGKAGPPGPSPAEEQAIVVILTGMVLSHVTEAIA